MIRAPLDPPGASGEPVCTREMESQNPKLLEGRACFAFSSHEAGIEYVSPRSASSRRRRVGSNRHPDAISCGYLPFPWRNDEWYPRLISPFYWCIALSHRLLDGGRLPRWLLCTTSGNKTERATRLAVRAGIGRKLKRRRLLVAPKSWGGKKWRTRVARSCSRTPFSRRLHPRG